MWSWAAYCMPYLLAAANSASDLNAADGNRRLIGGMALSLPLPLSLLPLLLLSCTLR